MSKVNANYFTLKREYIFSVIERKLEELKAKVPGAKVLNLGIGDVALPLAPSIVQAICEATQEMGRENSIRGYGPSQGYAFLRKAVAEHEYAHLGIDESEIFISDGINSDAVNILELFDQASRVAITDPTYPAYLSASVMDGFGKKLITLRCSEKNGFSPKPPKEHADIVYLCSPNNPTGIAMTRKELTAWVDYAKRNEAILLYDNAYVAFITSPDVPKSIFEIPGAKEVAIEFRSFSKTAGFTGLRCAYAVLPKTVHARLGKKKISLHPLWMQRQNAKFNGVAYPIQKGALAVYTPQGQKETRAQVASYLKQAAILRSGLEALGYTCYGGVDSPFIWWKVPKKMGSWDFFDILLEKCHLISVPGRGFGSAGEGYVRLSAFTTGSTATETLKRIKKL